MRVELAYGRQGIAIDVPDEADVVLPKQVAGVANEGMAVERALDGPIDCEALQTAVRPGDRVAIVFSDITRPMPNDRVLPALLKKLAHVPREQIVLINALGTHRANTDAELREMLGDEIVEGYRIEQHDAWDADRLVDLGETKYGHRAWVNKTFLEATFRILTGFVEPHFFAGFSGGPKAVLPGVAGIESIMDNHSYEMLNKPEATWGATDGNPIWEEMREVAGLTRPDFLLNVTLNRKREITGVFAGELFKAHAQAVAFARGHAMVALERPYDIVVTTNSGYPLDQNLYQAVKGMSCAAQIVRQGGSIIIASECSEGVPEYGEYRSLVHKAGSVEGIMRMLRQPGFRHRDQWEAQLQARIQLKARVYVYSDGLSEAETKGMLLEPCADIQATVERLLSESGPDARICVIPDGPQTIPYIRYPREG